jgi:MerR family transcriptional regulator, repressor of the yfmOP operon
MEDKSGNEEVVTIGEVAKSLGLTTRTLRYWEEAGIIESVQRADGATRGYTPDFVRRIKFIIRLKDLGLTIKDMQDLYTVYGEAKQTDKMIPRLIERLDAGIYKIDEKMGKLASLRNDIVEYRQRILNKLKQAEQG